MRYKQISEGIQRAKSLVRDAIDTTIHFELTFPEYLNRVYAFHKEDWYKKLPRYAHAEVNGYHECYYQMKLETRPGSAVISAHLVNGILYRNFDEWRKAFPNESGSMLTDSCCSVYPSGKVFSHYVGRENSDKVGKTFPFYVGASRD